MLELIQSPGAVSFSKNPIIYKLQTNEYISTEGVSAVGGFRLPAAAEADTLTIAWLDHSLEFAYTGTPGFSGLHIRPNSGALPDINYLNEILIPDLKTNNTLYSNFHIILGAELGEYYVKLIAKETGTDYTLTITSSNGTLALLTPVSGVNAVVKENFRVVCDLIIYDENELEQVLISLEQEPDTDSMVEFSFEEYLNEKLFLTPPLYDPENISLILREENSYRKFKVRYYEKYGDPIVNYVAYSTEDSYVILGGLKQQDWPGNDITEELAGTAAKRFLTWHPIEKEISTKQREYLYFFLTKNIGIRMDLKVLITFTNGTTTESLIINLESPIKNSIYIIPTGFGQLGLSEYEESGAKIERYTVSLIDDIEEVLSEERTYIINRMAYQQDRNFLYETSLGGMDTLRAIGEAEQKINIDFDSSEKILPNNYEPSIGQREKINILFEEEFQVAAGLFDKEKIESLKDFLISKHHYQIVNNQYVSIELLNKSETVFNESDDLHPLIIKYKNNYTDKAFSK